MKVWKSSAKFLRPSGTKRNRGRDQREGTMQVPGSVRRTICQPVFQGFCDYLLEFPTVLRCGGFRGPV